MAGRPAATRYRGPVAARSRSAAPLHDRGTASPTATHDPTLGAMGVWPEDGLALDAMRGKPPMPERRHLAVAHLPRSLAALTARKDGPNEKVSG